MKRKKLIKIKTKGKGAGMDLVRKINVNNQRVFVIEKENGVYYTHHEDKEGNRDADPFWDSVITPEIYEQAWNDYKEGIVDSSFTYECKYKKNTNPIEDMNECACIDFTNWIAHVYMSWNSIDKCWIYGRNKNYIAETKKKIEFTEEYKNYLDRMQEKYESRRKRGN